MAVVVCVTEVWRMPKGPSLSVGILIGSDTAWDAATEVIGLPVDRGTVGLAADFLPTARKLGRLDLV